MDKQKQTNLKKYGTEYHIQSKSVKQKTKQTNLKKHKMEYYTNRNKAKQTCLKQYGVENPGQLKKFQYKQKQTKIEKEIQIPDEQLSEYKLFYKKVLKFTNKNLKKYGNEMFGKGWEEKRGKNKYNIDHKYSIQQGFLHKIPPEVIGSKWNLQLITEKENHFKFIKCIISKEELLNLYKNDKLKQ